MLFNTILGVWIFLEIMLIIKIIVGVYFHRFTPKRNGIIGFRTTKTLSSDNIWKIAHKEFGKLFIFFGIIELVASLFTLWLTYQGFINVHEIIVPISYLFIYICTSYFVIIYVSKKIKYIEE